MDDSPEVSTLSTGKGMDLVMDSVGLSGNGVEWRAVSLARPNPGNVGYRSCRGLAWRGRFCRGMSEIPEEGLRNRGFAMDGSNPAGRTFFTGSNAHRDQRRHEVDNTFCCPPLTRGVLSQGGPPRNRRLSLRESSEHNHLSPPLGQRLEQFASRLAKITRKTTAQSVGKYPSQFQIGSVDGKRCQVRVRYR
jgi:hypothetical protein